MPSSPRYPAADVAAALGTAGSVTFLGGGSFGDTWQYDDRAFKIICVDGYPPERLQREIEGLQKIDSPYVVKLLETVTITLGGKDRPVLVFEFIDGGDIQTRIDAADWPTTDEALALLEGLLVGAQDMHGARVVHRDIKPGNIALRGGDWGSPVILDLGLARLLDETTITRYPAQMGTWRYMAPEQLAGKRARKAADLFAIGTTVREVLAQQHPFHAPAGTPGVTLDDLIKAIEAGPTPLPAGVPAAAIDALDRLVAAPEHKRGSATSSLTRLHPETKA